MRQILRNTAFNAVGSVADRGGILVLTAMLSGALSPTAFAAFGQFQLTLTMLAAFSSVGIAASASRIFAQYDPDRPGDLSLLGTMWLLSLGAALVLSLVVAVLAVPGPSATPGLPPAALLTGLIALTLGVVANGGVLGLGLFKQGAVVSIITAGVLLTIGSLAAAQRSISLAALAVIAAYSVNSLLATLLVLRRVPFREVFNGPLLTRQSISNVTRVVGPLALVTLLAASGNWLLGQILNWGPDATSAFAGFIIGLQWFSLVQFLPGLVTRAVFPDMVRSVGGIDSRMKEALVLAPVLALTVVLGVAGLSPILAQFYDDRAVQGGMILIAYGVAALPQSVAGLLGNALIAQGCQSDWAWLTVKWFAVLLVSGGLFVPWGAMGMAMALFVSGSYLAVGAYVSVRKRATL